MTHRKSVSRLHPLWLSGIAALLVGAGTPQAWSAPPQFEKGTTIKVKFGDLNLGTPDGVKTLYQRIEGAARRACNDDAWGGDPMWHSHWRYCFRTAVARAVNDVNNQWLTAMYREKNGSTPVG